MKNKISKINGHILLKSGRVYDPFIGLNDVSDILIKDGIIIEVSNNISSKKSYKVINCDDKIITNGFIDLHAHFREPGFEFKETIDTGAMSAFYGGYTRVCIMPNTDPVIDSPELVKHLIDKSLDLPVYIYPIGSITKGQLGKELSEIGLMVSSGAVAISDDGLPVQNSQIMRMALEYAKKYKIPVINHAEDVLLINDGLVHEGVNSLKLGLSGNPDISESTMVYRDLSIAEYVGGKIHIPHVSTSKTIDVIKNFKSKGVEVTAEVTPHHIYLTDEDLLTYDTNVKVAPPIRSNKDRQDLITAIKEGNINCIATDHAPHAIEDKEKDFKHAACGMIGLESAFGIVNKALKDADIQIERIIDLFVKNPSQIMNIIPNTIEKNNEAELNVIDDNVEWLFDEDCIVSKSSNTPFINCKLKGRILATINKGFIRISK